ncbi:CHAT domain-containing protein [bacterium]|nr:MAG: CHAT domain-containing protein [bacterium]
MRNIFTLLIYLSGSSLQAQTSPESFSERVHWYFNLSEYDSVIQYYERTSVNEKDADSLAVALNLIAKCYYYLGQNGVSISTYLKILQNPPRDPAILAKVHCTYSEVLIETAQYELASSQLSHAERILSGIDRSDLVALMLNNRGVLCLRTSRHTEALGHLNSALQMVQANKESESKLLLLILNNMGIVYYDIGKYQDALIVFQNVLTIDSSYHIKKDLAVDYLNIASVYCQLNDKPNGIAFYQKAKQAYVDIKDSAGLSFVLGNLSTIFIEMKKYSLAEESLKEALQIAQRTGDRLGETEWLYSLVMLDYEKGNYSNCFDALEDVARRFLELKNFAQYGQTLIEMAKCKKKLNDYKKSEKLLLLAFENYKSNDLRNELWRAQSNLAEVYELQKRDREADSLFRESIKGIEDSRDDLSTELRTYFMESDRLDAYRSYALFLIRKNKKEQAFDIFEKAKARNLSDILRAGDHMTTSHTSIADSGLLIEYFLQEEQSYAFVKSSKNLKIIPVGKKEIIDRLIIDYLTQIKQKRKDRNSFLKLSNKLYKEVMEPLAEEWKSASHITIIPDGRLFYLPFESLFDGEGFVAEKFEWVYAPSASIALASSVPKSDKNTTDRISVFSPSQIKNSMDHSLRLAELNYAALEVDNIKKIFRDRANICSDNHLTGQAISDSVLASSSIIHFAAHGINNTEKPELSAIVLSEPDDANEGLLTAHEIQKMQLSGKLVVLSACETSVGQLLQGEGMLGLTRAFMIAGASAVVASLWKVYDESTAEFMRTFYEKKVALKLSNSKALQQAKIAMIKNELWNDPAFWAPFVLWGTSN